MLGRSNEVVEHVLFLELHPGFVPGRVLFTTTPQIRDRIHAAWYSIHPAIAGEYDGVGRVLKHTIGIQHGAVAAIDQTRLFCVESQ